MHLENHVRQIIKLLLAIRAILALKVSIVVIMHTLLDACRITIRPTQLTHRFKTLYITNSVARYLPYLHLTTSFFASPEIS